MAVSNVLPRVSKLNSPRLRGGSPNWLSSFRDLQPVLHVLILHIQSSTIRSVSAEHS